MPVCSAKVSRRRSSAGTRPKSSSAFGPQLDGQAAHVVQRLEDLLADGGQRLGALAVVPGLFDRLQAEEHGGQLLTGLVVELARQASAFELLRLDNPAQRVAGDAGRKVDGDRGARGERLSEAKVVVAEARVVAFLVVGADDTDRATAGDRRDVEARASTERPRRPPGRPRDRPRASRLARARRLSSTPPLFDPARLELQAEDVLCSSPSAASIRGSRRGGQGDRHHPRADQAAQPPGDELQQTG